MSEFQNSLFIALITGSFTVIGLVIGALLEFWREKLQYIREKENKQNETAEENKKSKSSINLTIFQIT
jgi:predicted histidine transporter YuiF (NhaC family)